MGDRHLTQLRVAGNEDIEPSCIWIGSDESLADVVSRVLPDSGRGGSWQARLAGVRDSVFRWTGRRFPDRARVLLIPPRTDVARDEEEWLEGIDYQTRALLALRTSDPRVEGVECVRDAALTLTVDVRAMFARGDDLLLVHAAGIKRLVDGQDVPLFRDRPGSARYEFVNLIAGTACHVGRYHLSDAGQFLSFDGETGRHLGRRERPMLSGELRGVRHISFLHNGEVVVIDETSFVSEVPGRPLQRRALPLADPGDIAVTSTGRIVLVDRIEGRILEWDPAGRGHLTEVVLATEGRDLAVAGDAWDNLFVLDREHGRVYCLGPNRQLRFAFGTIGASPGQFREPRQIAAFGTNSLAVSDGRAVQIFRIEQT